MKLKRSIADLLKVSSFILRCSTSRVTHHTQRGRFQEMIARIVTHPQTQVNSKFGATLKVPVSESTFTAVLSQSMITVK